MPFEGCLRVSTGSVKDCENLCSSEVIRGIWLLVDVMKLPVSAEKSHQLRTLRDIPMDPA